MKRESHIAEARLLLAAKTQIRLEPLEIRHMENCPQCVDRLAKLVTELMQDNKKDGRAI